MSIPRLSDAPAPPLATDTSTVFDAKAFLFAAFMAALPDEMNATLDGIEALAASLTTQGFSGTSATSLTIGTGVKTLIASSGAAFVGGQSVVIASAANPANSMTGTVVSYDTETGEMEVNVGSVSGSGTFADWTIGLALVADLSGYLQKAGGTMTGLLTLAAALGLVLTPGGAPSSKVDGQVWRETGKLMVRIGSTDYEVSLIGRTQTDSNKTLTSPTINGGTISGATISGGTVGSTAITQRVIAAGATTGTLTPNCGTTDEFKAAGLTGAVTMAAPTGTPTTEQKLIVYLDDNGTSRAITWTTSAGGFRAGANITLPTATTSGKWTRVACMWNADDGYWDVVAVVAQA